MEMRNVIVEIKIEDEFVERYEDLNKLKDELWEKVCDVCETGDNFSLSINMQSLPSDSIHRRPV